MNETKAQNRLLVVLLTLLVSLVGVGVAILVAGVPWAFSVHGRLTAIEQQTLFMTGVPTEVRGLETRVQALEGRIVGRTGEAWHKSDMQRWVFELRLANPDLVWPDPEPP